jgi:hypothetical protein
MDTPLCFKSIIWFGEYSALLTDALEICACVALEDMMLIVAHGDLYTQLLDVFNELLCIITDGPLYFVIVIRFHCALQENDETSIR